jgi:hypothetical protein
MQEQEISGLVLSDKFSCLPPAPASCLLIMQALLYVPDSLAIKETPRLRNAV